MEAVYWTMRDGQKINVDDMDVKHLRNTLKMIIKNKAVAKPTEPRHWSGLNGEMAQDHVDQWYFRDYEDQL